MVELGECGSYRQHGECYCSIREQRTEAESNGEGFFYAYLPPESSGAWSVGVIGVNCKSRIMDSACSYKGSFEPMSQQLPGIPPAAPVTITYRP